jgi:IS30 family transposase
MSYQHLTQEERYQIAILFGAGFSRAHIARELQRHPSTILRELRRNRAATGYRAATAQGLAQCRLPLNSVHV